MYHTDDNYNWAHKLWLDNILNNQMQGTLDCKSGNANSAPGVIEDSKHYKWLVNETLVKDETNNMLSDPCHHWLLLTHVN